MGQNLFARLFRRPIVVNIEPVVVPEGACVLLLPDREVTPAMADAIRAAVPPEWAGRVLIVDSAVRTLVLERHWPADGGTEVAA